MTDPPRVQAPITPELLDGLAKRAGRPDFARFEAQLRSSGYCARPVRLRGHVEVCDGHGRRQRVWSTDGEPDGILRKACGNRREAVCAPCAERYRGDAYQLIAAGLRGGKGVPDTVTQHPAVFVTLTAPSFGTVHTRAVHPNGQPRRCRPRRDAETCSHGVRLSCPALHEEDDPCLGEPLCPACFDHAGAVVWNNHLGELWRRTSIYLPRHLAAVMGMTQKRLRETVRVAYAKVAEYQRRGLVHLHVVIRLDRAMPDYRAQEIRPPDPRFGIERLEEAIRSAAGAVRVQAPAELGGGELRRGRELDIRRLDVEERRRIAGYLAKYSTKSTEQAGGLLHRISPDEVERAPVRDHVRRYLHAAFALHERNERATKQRRREPDRAQPAAPARPPTAVGLSGPDALAWRARVAMSHGDRVCVRVRDAGRLIGRITRIRTADQPRDGTTLALTLDTGLTIALADVAAIGPVPTSEPPERRDPHDRRLAACAHSLGYRGHCLTKSRRYSTTFKALRGARERHVHEQLLAHAADESPRQLADTAKSDQIRRFEFAGQGHLTTADAFLARSAEARAREERQAARLELQASL